MKIFVPPPHGPVTILLTDGRLRYVGKSKDVEYVQMLVEQQAGVLGHAEGGVTPFDIERRVFAAFGGAAQLITGESEVTPALNRSVNGYFTQERIP